MVKEEKIEMKYIPTTNNVADIFTKSLAKPKYTNFIGKLGLGTIKEYKDEEAYKAVQQTISALLDDIT